MKLTRTVFSGLYLLLMVLLPWLHMPLHADKPDAEVAVHNSCAHDHGHQDREPTPADDCGWCQLAVLPAQNPETLTAPQAVFTLSEVPDFLTQKLAPPVHQLHQARAPPSLTV